MINENGFIPILMYHEVTDNPESLKQIRKIDPDYSQHYTDFEEQMGYLFRHGYETITCKDLVDNTVNKFKPCIITFDDGLAGNFLFAFPILKKFNFTATIFVTIAGVGSDRFMNWDQLQDLEKSGFSIQSHCYTHRGLGELNEKQIFYELSQSKLTIEDNLKNEVKYLSLPFGSFNKLVFKIAKSIGYQAIFTSMVYRNNSKYQIPAFGRIPIKASDDLQKFRDMIQMRPNCNIMIKLDNSVKFIIKKIIGLNNYRKVYRLVYRIKLD